MTKTEKLKSSELKNNVVMLPLRLGGSNAPRVDVSILKIIGSTFEGQPRVPDTTQNVFATDV